MSERLPFDPAPRPGEAAAIVARGRRRKALRAAVPLSAVAVVAVSASLLSAPTSSYHQLELADDPLTEVTETAAASPSVADADPAAAPDAVAAPIPVVTIPPALHPSSSPSPTPGSTRSPQPGEKRPYRGELGPRVEEYAYPACRQSQLAVGSRTYLHAGYCVQPTFRGPAASGVTDLAPTLRLCWQAESVYNGTLEFQTQAEADFSVYDDEGRRLYRFSDTVTYTQRPRERVVLQGDCLVWSLRLPFDADRHGPGQYTLRFETTTTTFEPRARQVEVVFEV